MERKCVLKSIAMSNRPTPETDAETRKTKWDDGSVTAHHAVGRTFAERLERERDEALDQERIHYDNYQSLRAHAERLAAALEYYADIVGPPDKEPDWWSDNDCDKAWADSQAALAAYRAASGKEVAK
jgi:hypothetical protein